MATSYQFLFKNNCHLPLFLIQIWFIVKNKEKLLNKNKGSTYHFNQQSGFEKICWLLFYVDPAVFFLPHKVITIFQASISESGSISTFDDDTNCETMHPKMNMSKTNPWLFQQSPLEHSWFSFMPFHTLEYLVSSFIWYKNLPSNFQMNSEEYQFFSIVIGTPIICRYLLSSTITIAIQSAKMGKYPSVWFYRTFDVMSSSDDVKGCQKME